MGYRSDVALALNGESVKSFRKKLVSSETNSDTRKAAEALLAYADDHRIDDDTGSECWCWNDLKWYTGDPTYFPDVDFIENFLSTLPDENFYFIRIGEDTDDTEIRGAWWDNPFGITLCRKIILDC